MELLLVFQRSLYLWCNKLFKSFDKNFKILFSLLERSFNTFEKTYLKRQYKHNLPYHILEFTFTCFDEG